MGGGCLFFFGGGVCLFFFVFFLSENFQFLEVKISIYLNRHVFVMMIMFPCRTENLKKGAAPVNNDDIIDMIQTNMFAEIGCGKYRSFMENRYTFMGAILSVAVVLPSF